MDHRHHHHKSLTKMLLNHQYMSIDQSYRKEIFFFNLPDSIRTNYYCYYFQLNK